MHLPCQFIYGDLKSSPFLQAITFNYAAALRLEVVGRDPRLCNLVSCAIISISG